MSEGQFAGPLPGTLAHDHPLVVAGGPALGTLSLMAEVMGPPAAYGNKRAWVNPKTGRAVVSEAKGKNNVRVWQDALRSSMLRVAENYLTDETLATYFPKLPLEGPLLLVVTAYFQRPKSHYGKKGVKKSAAPIPTMKPDGDKIARAAADCGTGIWYRDDSCVSDWIVRKRWSREGQPSMTSVIAIPVVDLGRIFPVAEESS